MLGRRLHHPGTLTVPTTLKAGAGQGLPRGGTGMDKETQSPGQDTLGEELGRWGEPQDCRADHGGRGSRAVFPFG